MGRDGRGGRKVDGTGKVGAGEEDEGRRGEG